jgi:poly(3-hydroxybutyrate) depolymerase
MRVRRDPGFRFSTFVAFAAASASAGCSGSSNGESGGPIRATGGTTASGGATTSKGTGGAVPSGGNLGSGGTAKGGGANPGGSGGSTGGAGASGSHGGDTIGGSGGSTGGTGYGGAAGAGTAGNAGGLDSGGEAGTSGSAGAAGSSGTVPSAGCGKARTLEDGYHTIRTSGMSRTYYLKAPANYDNMRAHRLIFTFHWNYGSADAIVNPPDADRNTDRPFYGLADLSGDSAIYVAPEGLVSSTGGKGWANTNNQDVIFTDDMLAAISADLCIDTSRVFTTGFSFGAAMSYKLACVRPDQFRAALVYEAGAVSGNDMAECTKPIAWFHSQGADDQGPTVATGLTILNLFAELNGCTAMTPPSPATDEHLCVSLEGCSAGYPTRWCSFGAGQNNPHNPSLRGHYPSPKDPGETTSWVPAEAWKFISQL